MGLKRKIEEGQIKSSGRAGLIGMGLWMVSRKIMEVIKEQVKIKQKAVKYEAVEKLISVVVMILGGGRGISEINKQVRPEKKLAGAFGIKGCAEQSVIQETLDRCDEKNVREMEEALKKIYRKESLGYKHKYEEGVQILDVDLSGKKCGKGGEEAKKGYFSGEKNVVGRQIGRVVASRYGEIVVERLYAGNTTLVSVQQELIEQAAGVLELDEEKRGRTIVRLDAGGGSQDQVEWLEEQGFLYCTKEYSGKRVMKLIPKDIEWIPDPKTDGREVAFREWSGKEVMLPLPPPSSQVRLPSPGPLETAHKAFHLTPLEPFRTPSLEDAVKKRSPLGYGSERDNGGAAASGCPSFPCHHRFAFECGGDSIPILW